MLTNAGGTRLRVGSGKVLRGPSAVSPFVLMNEFAFGTHARPTVESGAALCRVNSGGTAWECVDSTGAGVGTVTQGTGTTYTGTFAGSLMAINDVTGAAAPLWDNGGLGIFNGDFTVIAAGFATTATDATYQHWLDLGNFYIRSEGGNLNARFGSAGLVAFTTNPARNGWAVVTARKNGTSHTMRVNGTTGTPNVFADDLPTGVNASHFGSSDGAALPLRGPLAWVYFVPRHLTDAEVLALELGWWGAPTTLTATSSPDCLDNTAVSGQVDCFGTSAPMVSTATGLRTTKSFQNVWSATPLDVASGTAVNTPTTTPNASNGPFSRYKNAAECDLVVDDDGAAFEGYQGATAGTTAGNYTAVYFLKPGTSGTTTDKARLTIDTDGTGSTTCDVTLSGTTRPSCSTLIGGSPTYIRSSILVGNTAAQTGSITVCHSQLNAAKWAESPAINNDVVGNSDQRLDLAAIPSVTANAKFETVFTAVFDPNADWLTSYDNVRVFDATPNAGGHYAFIIYGYQNAGDAYAITSNGLSDSSIILLPGAVSLTAGQLYATSIEWRGSGASCTVILRLNTCGGSVAACVATTQIGSASGQCPSQPDRVWLAERYNMVAQTSMQLSTFRVYTATP